MTDSYSKTTIESCLRAADISNNIDELQWDLNEHLRLNPNTTFAEIYSQGIHSKQRKILSELEIDIVIGFDADPETNLVSFIRVKPIGAGSYDDSIPIPIMTTFYDTRSDEPE